jgi:hypothetical protein
MTQNYERYPLTTLPYQPGKEPNCKFSTVFPNGLSNVYIMVVRTRPLGMQATAALPHTNWFGEVILLFFGRFWCHRVDPSIPG